jgi:DNA-binding transcriptional regulator YiaG
VRPSDLAAAVQARAVLRSGEAARQREAADITAADFARALGVTRQAVRAWETNAAVPTAEHALAYGKLLAALEQKAA